MNQPLGIFPGLGCETPQESERHTFNSLFLSPHHLDVSFEIHH
jgi:hypothetical protein